MANLKSEIGEALMLVPQHDPRDNLATIFQHFGIDNTQEFRDPQGRPIPLTRGMPTRELI